MKGHTLDRASAGPALPCACATLRRASRAVTQFYNHSLLGSGLEITQFTFLQALASAGELTQGQIAEVLVIDSTTLTRSLKPLQQKGWITSRPGDDRRQKLFRITVGGRHVLERARPHWRQAQDRLRQSLGDAGWNLLMLSADMATGAARQ